MSNLNSIKYNQPDVNGRYGEYGGKFVPETLMSALAELDNAYEEASKNTDFWKEFNELSSNYVGRPTQIYFAKNLSKKLNGPDIYIKREDLTHTGAHKINNAIGQALLAKKLGKE